MNAYADKKRTAEDVADELGTVDEKTRHNFMSLMANTMSDEDYAKACDEGFDMSRTDPAESETILDHIKAALIMSGEDIAGFTDTLDAEKLSSITGSEGMGQALTSAFREYDMPLTQDNVEDVTQAAERMMELPPLSDGAVQYLTENELDPTVDNIYLAQHSGAGAHRTARGYYAQETTGYYAQAAQETDWEQIEPQAREVVKTAGFTLAEKKQMAEDQAKWMVTAGVPLTAESLTKVMELRGLQLPSSMEEAVAAATAARSSGRPAASAEPGSMESDIQRAIRYKNELDEVSDDAVESVVRSGKPLTLKNLREAGEREQRGYEEAPAQPGQQAPGTIEADLLRARRQIEEARLSMSVETNLRLMEWGVRIDITPMVDLIGKLNRAISDIERGMFGEGARAISAEGATASQLEAEPAQQLAEQSGTAVSGPAVGERLTLFRESMRSRPRYLGPSRATSWSSPWVR